MNNWNPIESRLRAWKLRSPSAELKARLFEQPQVASQREMGESVYALNLPELTRWLVPAIGCFLIAVSSLGSRTAQPLLFGTTNDLLSDSGQAQYSAYVDAPAFHTGMNSLPLKQVEWHLGTAARTQALPLLGQFTTNLTR